MHLFFAIPYLTSIIPFMSRIFVELYQFTIRNNIKNSTNDSAVVTQGENCAVKGILTLWQPITEIQLDKSLPCKTSERDISLQCIRFLSVKKHLQVLLTTFNVPSQKVYIQQT